MATLTQHKKAVRSLVASPKVIIVLYDIYYTILYYTLLCNTIIYYTTLYYTTLYYTILYYILIYVYNDLRIRKFFYNIIHNYINLYRYIYVLYVFNVVYL